MIGTLPAHKQSILLALVATGAAAGTEMFSWKTLWVIIEIQRIERTKLLKIGEIEPFDF